MGGADDSEKRSFHGLLPPPTAVPLPQRGRQRRPLRRSCSATACHLPRRGEANLWPPPRGRDALRQYAGGILLAKAGSKLRLRPGPKAVRRSLTGGVRFLKAFVLRTPSVTANAVPPPSVREANKVPSISVGVPTDKSRSIPRRKGEETSPLSCK